MTRIFFACLLLCTSLLFRQSLSESPEILNTSYSYDLSGTYIYLNTSAVTHSNLPKCPHSVSIGDDALQPGVATQFAFNLTALNISSENCTYKTEHTEIVELRNHTVPVRNFTIWNMTLPENTLKCSPESPAIVFPGGNLLFVPSMGQKLDTSTVNEAKPGEELEMTQTDMKTFYTLVFENVTDGYICTFFPEVHYKEIIDYVEHEFPEYPPSFDPHDDDRPTQTDARPPRNEDHEEMKIGKGKSLNFCPICKCQETLGTDLDLDSIEMSEEELANMSPKDTPEVPTPEADEDDGWRPPIVLVGRKRCPITFSMKLEDVINESEDSDENRDDPYKKTKDLVLRAVVDKIYDEIKVEYEEEWDNMEFDMRREMVTAFMMMKSLRRRRVMVMRNGARCGKERNSINKDTVFLYEKKHILWQLHRNRFVMKNSAKVEEIRDLETETEHSFTLHVFRKNKDERLSACTFANSKRSCDLLNSQEFCNSFKPLGTLSVFGDSNGTSGVPGDRKPTNGTGSGEEEMSDKPGGNKTVVTSPEASPETENPQGNTSPTPTASPGTPSTSASCFPAEAKVELEDGVEIRMDELTIGDSIRDGSGEFSKVILLTHANKNVVSKFIRLETSSADIVVSAQHYIPVNGKLMTAESIKEGDVIYVLKVGRKMEAVVTKVERVSMAGLFNPQTISGTLAVRMNGDAVVASAYTAGVDPKVAHTLLTPLRMLNHLAGVVVPWSWCFKNGNDQLVRMLPSGKSVVVV